MTPALTLLLAGLGAVVLGYRMADQATEPTTKRLGATLAAAGLVLTLGAAVAAVAVAVL